MVDYSSQKPGEKRGRRTESIDPELFMRFLRESSGFQHLECIRYGVLRFYFVPRFQYLPLLINEKG